ncbi:hypothetical protein YC2023_016648 [Brassica napus]
MERLFIILMVGKVVVTRLGRMGCLMHSEYSSSINLWIYYFGQGMLWDSTEQSTYITCLPYETPWMLWDRTEQSTYITCLPYETPSHMFDEIIANPASYGS